MHNTGWVWIIVGAVTVFGGVFNYSNVRRNQSTAGVRRFLLWYAAFIAFMVCAACGVLYHRLHWLFYVSGAIAVGSVLVQIYGFRRAATKARSEAADAAGPLGYP